MKLTTEQLKELKSAAPKNRPAMLYQLATIDQIERCLILLQEPLLQSLLLKGYSATVISSSQSAIELSEPGARYRAATTTIGFPNGGYLAIANSQWVSIQDLSLLRKYIADLLRNIRHLGLSITTDGKNCHLSPVCSTPSCDQRLINLAKSHHSQILAYKKHRNYDKTSTDEIIQDINNCNSRAIVLVAGSHDRVTKLVAELSKISRYVIYTAQELMNQEFLQRAVLAQEAGDLSYYGVVLVLVESRSQLRSLRKKMSLPELVLP